MIKHIVFDWDGTLVDTLPFLQETFAKTFAYLGEPPMAYAEIRRLLSLHPEKNIFRLIFGEKQAFRASRYFYDYTRRYHLKNLQQISYASEILEYCRQNQIKCYIFSTKRNVVLHRELLFLGWNDYFCKVSGAPENGEAKPNTAACQQFWEGKMPHPAELLVLGDGPTDVKTAQIWGCRAVILDMAQKYRGDNPDYKLKSLKEFIPLLQSMLY